MLICDYCEATTTKAGTPFKNQGSLNLHMHKCEKNPNRKKNIEVVEHIQDQEKSNVCPDCESDMFLLNENYPSHKQAIEDGFTLICMKDGVLI